MCAPDLRMISLHTNCTRWHGWTTEQPTRHLKRISPQLFCCTKVVAVTGPLGVWDGAESTDLNMIFGRWTAARWHEVRFWRSCLCWKAKRYFDQIHPPPSVMPALRENGSQSGICALCFLFRGAQCWSCSFFQTLCSFLLKLDTFVSYTYLLWGQWYGDEISSMHEDSCHNKRVHK